MLWSCSSLLVSTILEIFFKTKRVLSASLVLALGLVVFPTLPIPVQADDSVDFSSVDGAKLLENTKEKKAVQLEAALSIQSDFWAYP